MPGGRGQKSHRDTQIAARTAKKPRGRPPGELTPLRKAVLELYGRGIRRPEAARQLVDYLSPQKDPPEKIEVRLKRSRSLIRSWEQTQWFRDALYKMAIIDTDLAVKDIMKGVTSRAKEGSVEAAKYAMEIAGRYTPKGDQAPANVTVVFAGLPRPARHQITRGADVEVDAEALDE